MGPTTSLGTPGAVRGVPGERPPGALVSWLPPEGIDLALAWFRREQTRRLEGARAARPKEVADPDTSKLTPEKAAAVRDQADARRRAGVEQVQRRIASAESGLASLDAVKTELDLARWISEHEPRIPEPWQLWELHLERAKDAAAAAPATR